MRVFLSWSGDLSRQVAGEFSKFLTVVIQRVKPWLSDASIQSGAMWSREIVDSLGDSSVGVSFVTQSNKESPWLMFEAGAIAKGIPDNRVCALLVDCKKEDVKPPLSMFQLNTWSKDDVFKVLQTINSGLGEDRLPDEVLAVAMNAHWLDLDAKVQQILTKEPTGWNQPREQRDMIVEILETVRGFDQALRLARPPSWSHLPGLGILDPNGGMGQPIINWQPGGDLRMTAGAQALTTGGGLLGAVSDLDREKK